MMKSIVNTSSSSSSTPSSDIENGNPSGAIVDSGDRGFHDDPSLKCYKKSCKQDSNDHGSSKYSLGAIKEVLFSNPKFMFGSLFYIVVWSCLCAYGETKIQILAEEGGPDSLASKWLEYVESASRPLGIIGSLFSFSLVFRFKMCYDRWWGGRQLWGKIIAQCLDVATQIQCWVVHPELRERFTRYVIVFGYACKCQLRDTSLSLPDGDGRDLIDRGLLTQNELDDIHQYPSWQPVYFLDLMRQMVVQGYLNKGSYIVEEAKQHGQLYRCFDNTIKKMNDLIGDCIALQAAHLPLSYDQIHIFVFYLYFTVASVVWSVTLSWLVVPMTTFVAWIYLCFIILGTNMVDPFGTDRVDIPLESFCETIEAQIMGISERRKREVFTCMASSEKAVPKSPKLSKLRKGSSFKVCLQ